MVEAEIEAKVLAKHFVAIKSSRFCSQPLSPAAVYLYLKECMYACHRSFVVEGTFLLCVNFCLAKPTLTQMNTLIQRACLSLREVDKRHKI